MECGPKPQALGTTGEAFLWCGKVQGIKRGRPEKACWKNMQTAAEQDRDNWQRILESMSRFECRVEVKAKPGADYQVFPPVDEKSKGKNPQEATQGNKSKGVSPLTSFASGSLRYNQGDGRQSARTPSAVGKPSRLRQEVISVDQDI